MNELLELFLSEDEKEFQEKFNQILSEVPNKVGNEENFWIYFFLGSILTIPATSLQKSLNIQKVEVKLSSDQRTLNLCITIGGKVIFRSIKTEDKYPIIEYKEDSALFNEDGFIEISKISAALSLGKKVTKKSVKDLLENLAKIYNYYEEQDLELKQKTEALHQAFLYGFMKMNNEIDCFIEFGAGLGIADLILKVDDTSVVVECKAGSKTAIDAMEQIKDRGYFCLEILGKCKSVFLVGSNFNLKADKRIKVEERKIFKPQGLINVLMKDEKDEEQLEEKIKKELEFLCYSKNIGICNFDNPSNKDEFDPKNKYVGSFTALVLGQMLQYCSQNEECEFERVTTRKEKKIKYKTQSLLLLTVITNCN